MPKISVIIPVYNVEKHIERCARSLFEQTLNNIEFIFVDDASLDNSILIIKDVLEEFPNRKEQVLFITHKKNVGSAEARNSGLRLATGDFIAFCDSDDWIEREGYMLLHKKAIQENADVVTCNFFYEFNNGRKIYNFNIIDDQPIKLLQKYITEEMTPLWNMIVRRRIYKDYNLMFTNGIDYCEDYALTVKLLHKAKKVIHVNHFLYHYNQQNVSSLLHTRGLKAETDEINANLDLINYFKKENEYTLYAKQLCWRMLKAKQEWILNPQYHELFMKTFPECHRYIWSCPMINHKLKVMMWCKTHYLGFITNGFIKLRKVFNR